MTNSNYVSGRRFEYQVKDEYEESGYTVIRASGSHGPYDLVALHPSGQVILIQCKVVKNEAAALNLKRHWEPHFTPAAYNQVLAVKIKGKSDYLKFYAD